jgi:CheY-like chemotaxis protein
MQAPSSAMTFRNSKSQCDTCHVHDTKSAHFLRHEVKNGVLAAMALVESLQDSSENDNASSTMVPSSHLIDLSKTLNDLLDRTVDFAMTLEVANGDYGAAVEAVDVRTALSKTTSTGCARFPVVSSPDLPQALLLDPNLIRIIHNNAISNACKFGKQNGLVTTLLKYDTVRQVLQLQVTNEPANSQEQEQLLQLTHEEKDSIFQEHTLLASNNRPGADDAGTATNSVVTMAQGNGAWIMENCARALKGHCTIDFSPHSTVLTLECPAPQVVPQVVTAVTPVGACGNAQNSRNLPADQNKALGTSGSTVTKDVPPFHLPEKTWCIVVEDSAVQRKLLSRSLTKAGVPSERCLILGKKPEEILDFVQQAQDLISTHKEDRFLVIMDEHLDIVEEEGTAVVSKTVSGSYSVQKLREALEPSQESRLLSLIRSANDSRQEQRLYQQRAHGFITKGPIPHGNLMQVIQPFWQQRFVLPPKAATAKTAPQTPLRLRFKKKKVKPMTSVSSSGGNSTMDSSKYNKSMPSLLPSCNRSNSNVNACWSSFKPGTPSSPLLMSLVSVGKHTLFNDINRTANLSMCSVSSLSSIPCQRSCTSSPTLTISYGTRFANAG